MFTAHQADRTLPENTPRRLQTALPSEVIDQWLEGKYTGGPSRTLAYDRLGWALMLRGMYEYEIRADNGNGKIVVTHRGYCILDLYGGELRCYGIRVYTGDRWDAYLHYQPHPCFWSSEVCHIKPHSTHEGARLTCLYYLLLPGDWQGVDHSLDEFHDVWSNKLQGVADPSNEIRQREARAAANYFSNQYMTDHRKTWDCVKKNEDAQKIYQTPKAFLAAEHKKIHDGHFTEKFLADFASDSRLRKSITKNGVSKFADVLTDDTLCLLEYLKKYVQQIARQRNAANSTSPDYSDLATGLAQLVALIPQEATSTFLSDFRQRLNVSKDYVAASINRTTSNQLHSHSDQLEQLARKLKNASRKKTKNLYKKFRRKRWVRRNVGRKRFGGLLNDYFRSYVADLWSRLRLRNLGGFMFELRAFAPKQDVEFEGDYGAFGENSVGGRIVFTRIDDKQLPPNKSRSR